MAITTVAGIPAGQYLNRNYVATGVGAWGDGNSMWRWSGLYQVPTAQALVTPGVNGANLDGTTDTTKCIPFVNPASGSAYLESISGAWGVASSGITPARQCLWLIDVLWYNSGITVTTTTEQTFTPPALPSRDRNGATTGEGLGLALLVTSTTTSTNSTATIRYTNTTPTGTRTATIEGTLPASAPAGTFIPFSLQAGDTGVSSIQGITLATTLTAGAISLVLFRPVATLHLTHAAYRNKQYHFDALTLGLPPLYNGTALWLMGKNDRNESTVGHYNLRYTSG